MGKAKVWEKPGRAETPGRGRGFAADRGFEKTQQDAIVDLYARADAGDENAKLVAEAFDSLAERVEALEAESGAEEATV